jgi:Fe2+ transport system protein FeoA
LRTIVLKHPLARGPFGGQPLALRLNRRTIAIRGDEASAISVERVR